MGRTGTQKENTMPQKDTATVKTSKAKPPITAFLAKIMQFAKADRTVDLGGRLQNVIKASGKRGGFKQNQRMERKRSRTRKMKTSAR